MIEQCDFCGKQHEVERYMFFGVPVRTCPEIRSDQTPVFTATAAYTGSRVATGPIERLSDEDNEGVSHFIEKLREADVHTRQHMIDVLRANVCIHCGDPNPECQCWNDE